MRRVLLVSAGAVAAFLMGLGLYGFLASVWAALT